MAFATALAFHPKDNFLKEAEASVVEGLAQCDWASCSSLCVNASIYSSLLYLKDSRNSDAVSTLNVALQRATSHYDLSRLHVFLGFTFEYQGLETLLQVHVENGRVTFWHKIWYVQYSLGWEQVAWSLRATKPILLLWMSGPSQPFITLGWYATIFLILLWERTKWRYSNRASRDMEGRNDWVEMSCDYYLDH